MFGTLVKKVDSLSHNPSYQCYKRINPSQPKYFKIITCFKCNQKGHIAKI